jgi:hypothetical protein
LKAKCQEVIKLSNDLEENGLSNIYFWSGDDVLFLSGNKKYYKLKIGIFSLQEIDLLEVEKDYCGNQVNTQRP